MSKRSVAIYAKHSHNSSDENAFLERARRSTSDILSYKNGSGFMQNLRFFFGDKNIDILRVHSHGFWGGIIADENNSGIYTQESYNSLGTSNAIASYDIAGSIRDGQIKLAQNAHIILYGCNNSLFALELCRYINFHGRKDISVTGADNSVYEVNGMAKVDGNLNGITKSNASRFYTYKQGIAISSSKTLSYK